MQAQKKLVLILGSTGKSGFHIAMRLLDLPQYSVRVLVRSRKKAQELFKEKQIAFEKIIEGQIDENGLSRAFEPSKHQGEVKIVVSALGATGKVNAKQVEEIEYISQVKIVEQCLQNKVEKYYYVSAAYMERPWNIIPFILSCLVPNVYYWKAMTENYIRNSGLNYAIIRPPGLTGDCSCTNVTGYKIGGGRQITRPTLAVVVEHAMSAESLAPKVTFECVGDPTNKGQIADFKSIQTDTAASILRPRGHVKAKRVYLTSFAVTCMLLTYILVSRYAFNNKQ